MRSMSALTLVVVAIAATACGADETDGQSAKASASAFASPTRTPSLVASVEDTSRFASQASFGGRLTLEGSCYYLKSRNRIQYIPVFRRHLLEEHGESFAYDGREYTSGDRVRFGGGVGLADKDFGAEFSVPSSCDASTNYWFVGQTD